MRCGQLLAETTPTALLTKFQCPTLEDAFLILSQKQKDDQEKGMLVVGTEVIEDLDEVATHSTPASDVRDSVKVSVLNVICVGEIELESFCRSR